MKVVGIMKAVGIYHLVQRVYHRLGFGVRRYEYLTAIIRQNKCRRIMEIGTWNGEHALQMIKEAQKQHGGAVEYYGFDLFGAMDRNETSVRVVIQTAPSVESMRVKLGRTVAKIRLFKGNTQETLPQHVKELPKMDLIFIDGGHSLETIRNDWKYAQRLMADNTVVIFDDYWNREDAGCKTLVDAIDRDRFTVEVLPIQDSFKTDLGMLHINFVRVQKKAK